MAKYSGKSQDKVERAMHEMHEGKLKSGRSGKKVTNPKQAIAIGLSEAREEGAKVPKKAAAKKSSPAKRTTKTAAAKKSTTRKTTAKKSTAKKSTTRTSTTKKTVAKKGATAKRRAAPKKKAASSRKRSTRKATATA